MDNHIRALSKEGKISPREKPQPISQEEEDLLWKKGILGDDTPVKLSNTLVYLLGVNFALCAAEEHKRLKRHGNFSVHYDEAVGLQYLIYKETVSKCNRGGGGGLASRGFAPKTGRAYQNVINSDRCVVRLYERYIASHSDFDPKCSQDFYLRALAFTNSDVWYSCWQGGTVQLVK